VNVQLLIDAIVRQVTVLIAQLATAGGLRAPLSHLANQIFVDLARELESQGVSRKVSADMFGMALRAYLRKLRRLTEGSTERGRTLWEAILDYIDESDGVTRDAILQRFARDDEAQVRGILHDLTESGLVFCAGAGPATLYRAVTEQELGRMRAQASGQGLEEMLWVLVYREGPLGLSELVGRMPDRRAELEAALQRLVESGRIQPQGKGGEEEYVAHDFSIPLNAPAGWEAAVFDHFQAMVQTICSRLAAGPSATGREDTAGGSTFSFDIWPGHPLEQEVTGSLSRLRQAHLELGKRVQDYNHDHGLPSEYRQVVVYAGQCVLERGDVANGGQGDE